MLEVSRGPCTAGTRDDPSLHLWQSSDISDLRISALNAHPLADQLHHLGEGGGDDGGESLAKFKSLGGDGDRDGPRAVTIQLLGTGEQPGGRAGVGK